MKKSLHPLDRILRGAIGVLAIGFTLFNDGYLEEPILEILLILFGILNVISLANNRHSVYHLADISICNRSIKRTNDIRN